MRRIFAYGLALSILLVFLYFYLTRANEVIGDPTARVHLASTEAGNYRLMRAGKPFIVRGASGISELSLLSDYGGNTIRVYRPDSLAAALAGAERHGLAVVADIPLPAYSKYGGDQAAQLLEMTASVTALVDRYRNHPSLLFWVLGNETFTEGVDADYVRAYNALLQAVRSVDAEHPVSTTLVLHQMVDLQLGPVRPDVDFYCFNVFGNLARVERLSRWLTLRWSGPYLISEWSYNGPWEAPTTPWGAPMEPPANKKAEQISERYHRSITAEPGGRLLGSLAFYWGRKYEQTPTWFSYFGRAGEISPMAFALRNCWGQTQDSFPGPAIDHLRMEVQADLQNVLLQGGGEASVELRYLEPPREKYTVA